MALDPHYIARLSQLLDEALALPVPARGRWLQALSPADAPLRERLRAMLAAASAGGRGAAAALDTLPRLDADDAPEVRAGDAIGPWRLRREIGRGGMGTVWLAERADGAYDRLVALKLPRLAQHAGLVARMANERGIAAQLEHPAIARLYEAGLDDQGQPYIAMEFVDGQPIDAWVREHGLDVAATLRLFVQVVRAVAHAHGRLVVHRDLKPSNVLVDAAGQAHLLDFGIAQRLGDTPDATEADGAVPSALTPHYAAPEQRAGGRIGVQADVYSLGVVLHELLTGALPLRQPEGASRRPASHGLADRARARALRGAVDAILARALADDPQARYPSAEALAEDLERHLRGDAVRAHRESAAQWLRRVARRHRLALAAGGAVAAALLVGSTLALVQARRADEEAQRALLVKTFVTDLFRVNSPGVTNAALGKLPAELLIQHGATLIESRFPDQPALRAELHGVVAGIFIDMGLPRLGADHASRQVAGLAGTRARAADQGRAVLLLARAQQAAKRHAEAVVTGEQAMQLLEGDDVLRLQAQMLLAQSRLKLGRVAETGAALDDIERQLAQRAPSPQLVRAEALWLRGQLAELDNRFDEQRRLAARAIDEALAADGPLSPVAASMRLQLAYGLMSRSHDEEAAREMKAGLDALRAMGGPSRVRAATEALALIRHRRVMGLVTHAEALEAAAFEQDSLRQLGALVPPIVQAWVDFELASIHTQWGDYESARRLLDPVLPQLEREVDTLDDRWRLATHAGSVAMATGQHALAERLLADRLAIRQQQGRGLLPFASFDHYYAALNLGMQGRSAEGLALLDRAPLFEDDKGVAGGDGAGYPRVVPAARARLLIEAGRLDEALALLEAIQSFGSEVDSTVLMKAEIQCRRGAPQEALASLAALEKSLRAAEGRRHADNPRALRQRAVAGLCALAGGRPAAAREWAALARRSALAQPSTSPWFSQPLRELEQRLGRTDALPAPFARQPSR